MSGALRVKILAVIVAILLFKSPMTWTCLDFLNKKILPHNLILTRLFFFFFLFSQNFVTWSNFHSWPGLDFFNHQKQDRVLTEVTHISVLYSHVLNLTALTTKRSSAGKSYLLWWINVACSWLFSIIHSAT